MTLDKIPVGVSFGLGKDIAVNAIIGKPTLKEWTGCIDFVDDIFTSVELNLSFNMEYKMADTGLPSNIMFDSTKFVRPKPDQPFIAQIVSIDRDTNIASVSDKNNNPTIIDNHVNGCMTRVVTVNKQM